MPRKPPEQIIRMLRLAEAGRSMTAEKVIDVLIDLFHLRGVPKHDR
jgi:hypothetical protein